jgi:hypothetical protein
VSKPKDANLFGLQPGDAIKVTGIEIHVKNPATGGLTTRTYP